ncbi:Os06g0579600 [Oryza sativa Japonica Group]|uniref:Os06g0579600 protein n=2 Tax=Oryza sativa subsp. japonica TaxID=39947 RepID=Q0DBC4_ORYSJ|nr:Os06g0579600 [Oryza sativa Japonica Group]BAS98365.1 Os06g0579600 [Oryza sativa Japonica Group]|eukprot:NP_001057935.1 Os06g0579600 [Oryza sativa Japonica Group]
MEKSVFACRPLEWTARENGPIFPGHTQKYNSLFSLSLTLNFSPLLPIVSTHLSLSLLSSPFLSLLCSPLLLSSPLHVGVGGRRRGGGQRGGEAATGLGEVGDEAARLGGRGGGEIISSSAALSFAYDLLTGE